MADTSQPSLPLDEPIREPDRAAFDFADVPRLLAAFFRWCVGNPAQARLPAEAVWPLQWSEASK